MTVKVSQQRAYVGGDSIDGFILCMVFTPADGRSIENTCNAKLEIYLRHIGHSKNTFHHNTNNN